MSTKKIIGTGKNPDIPKGKQYTESEDVAAIVVSKGEAVYEGGEVKEKQEQKHQSKPKEVKPAKSK